MAELVANLRPYELDGALERDGEGEDCFVLDVGADGEGGPVESVKWVERVVEARIACGEEVGGGVRKVYVVGEWRSAVDEEEVGDREHEFHGKSKSEREWEEAVGKIAKMIEKMPGLKELTWIAGIPFMSVVWETLPTSLTKLVLDLGQPIRIEQDGDIEYKSYITQTDMRPLVQQTELKELRLFRMHDSMQSVVWETIFMNVSESGMRVADLQMAAEPLVRATHWHKAEDVRGLTVPKQDSNEKEYKGIEGKGVLHHSFGMGEYLDAFCMRKARIAAGLDEAKPLPLWCLKLDGFVVDYLPFEHELSRISLLTCGKNCIDSGLRAPKTPLTPHNGWSKIFNCAISRCLVQWPNWTGTFDDHGDQHDNHGQIVSQETVLSTPANGPLSPSPMPLTKTALQMKEVGDAIDSIIKKGKGPPSLSKSLSLIGIEAPLSMASDVSVCGSDVATPAAGSVSPNSPKMPTVDGSATYSNAASMGASLTLVKSANTVQSGISTDSSFDNVSPVDGFAANGFDSIAPKEKTMPKTSGFKHKVRRSLDWLSSSRSDSGETV
ncbi:hypothetical protein COCVIDRAFT_42068 [Bipolaris victoriae FI3]|uniref:Uncharacterized protein n=1 Tax=Bipolaris victoriae (strain FI3) TaxID=930091 RepID=W7E819_BIPV3|nr:hypothetical protein COCVIDRAFT_42068 [Bipolaris victoriae FI3]